MEIKRTQEEIDAVLDAAQEVVDYQDLSGEYLNYKHITDRFHAKGVKQALLWVTGQTDDNPMEG